MELQTAFQKTWNEVEITFKNAQIRNHEVFVFAFCEAFESKAPDLHVIYDARILPNQGYRPNLYIWADKGEPTVIFMGEIKFKPESLTVLYQEIKELNEYTNRPTVEVLVSHDRIDIMKVSSDIELGYFVISDLALNVISKGITSLGPSQRELTKFHFAYGSVNGHPHFDYQEPKFMRIKK